MSLTLQETIDEILTRFKAVWDVSNTPIPYPVAYPDVPIEPALQQMIAGAEGVEITPWARVTVRPNLRRQKTFGGTGSRTFTTSGILYV